MCSPPQQLLDPHVTGLFQIVIRPEGSRGCSLLSGNLILLEERNIYPCRVVEEYIYRAVSLLFPPFTLSQGIKSALSL